MYSIIDKKDGMTHFIADSDDDLINITSCNPGSYVEVLEKKNIHIFVKSPSGPWVLVKGKSNLVIPKNDAKVSVPDPSEPFQGDPTKKIGDYQRGVKIYDNGLVTGTLLYNTAPATLYPNEEEQTGHYITANLETPEGASTYEIWTDGYKRKTVDCDGVLTVRMENMTGGKKIKVVYDDENASEFEFDLSKLVQV